MKPERAFAIDTNGARWAWNCGWRVVDLKGDPVRTQRTPLGHLAFRRAVTLVNPRNPAHREVLHGLDRPGRYWRRFLDSSAYDHPLFGSVYLLASDGCHAVIAIHDGTHKYVCFENLTERKPAPELRRPGEAKQRTVTRQQAAVTDMVAKLLNLTKQ
jgi:hypothetical protein